SSCANFRCSMSWSRSTATILSRAGWRRSVVKQLLDAVEDGRGDSRLALQRHLVRPGVTDDRHRIRVRLEAGVGARDVVGDDEVGVLAFAFRGSATDDVLGFGGETDEQGAGAAGEAPLAEVGEDVRRFL